MIFPFQAQQLLQQGEADSQTDYNISIIFYYTEAFDRVTVDIEGHTDELVTVTNFALKNSQIPITFVKHCALPEPIPENILSEDLPSRERLDTWKAFQGEIGSSWCQE